LIQGVPAYGIIDTAADITIIGGQLFCKVASVVHLKKKHFKHADKTPRNYDRRLFRLNGRMDLTIAFGNKEMMTSVYIRLDAVDQFSVRNNVRTPDNFRAITSLCRAKLNLSGNNV